MNKYKANPDSYVSNDVAEYYLDNNRKLILSWTNHINKKYINLRHWIKTTEAIQGGKWLPTSKGLFIPVDVMRTIWDDINKNVTFMLQEDEKSIDLGK
jgi:hypothetical protein